MTFIHNRKNLTDFLLRRQFGTLCPPPAPTIGSSATDLEKARMDRARRIAGLPEWIDPIPAKRAELDALPADEFQKLVDQAKEEDARKRDTLAAQARSKRDAAWPGWAKKDLWSEAEFAALCCGFIPDERGMPPDPEKGEHQVVTINRAGDDIRRGTLSGSLPFTSRDDADTASRMYGTARHFNPVKAVDWAVARFDTFPQGLADAVRERAVVSAIALAVADPSEAPDSDKPLDERERTTLLCVIGALARELKLDLAQPMKAGQTVAAMAPELMISARTIGEKLKLVSDAMESRRG